MPDAENKVICLLQLDGKRHIDSSSIENAKLSDYPEIASLAQIGHLLPFLHTERHKPGTYSVSLPERLAVSCRLPYVTNLLPQERVVRKLRHIFLDEVYYCSSLCHNAIIIRLIRICGRAPSKKPLPQNIIIRF